MRGMGKAIAAIFKLLTMLGIPNWAIALGVGLLLWWGVPKLASNIDKDKARRVLLNSRLDDAEARRQAEEQALAIAGDDLHTLRVVAEEALREGRKAFAARVIDRLRAAGASPQVLMRLEDELYGPLPGLAVEAALRVERFLERGQREEARRLVERARRRWPEDADLADLAARLDEGDAEPGETPEGGARDLA